MRLIIWKVTCAGIKGEHLFHVLVVTSNSASLGILVVLYPFNLLNVLPLGVYWLHPRFNTFSIFNSPVNDVHFFQSRLNTERFRISRTNFFARRGIFEIFVVFPGRQQNQRTLVLELFFTFAPPLFVIQFWQFCFSLFSRILNLAHVTVESLENIFNYTLHSFQRFAIWSPHRSILFSVFKYYVFWTGLQ